MSPADALMAKVPMDLIPDAKRARTIDGIPYATHMGYLVLGELKLRCYQLNDGRRVIDASDPVVKSLLEGLLALPKT